MSDSLYIFFVADRSGNMLQETENRQARKNSATATASSVPYGKDHHAFAVPPHILSLLDRKGRANTNHA